MAGSRYPPARIGGVRLVTRFAPPLALMGLIFFFSAQPDLNSGLGVVDAVGRKLVHMAAFGSLWFLWWRASGYGHPGPAIAITLLYAVSDEYHQTFTAGRHGSPWDVAIDAIGVGLAWLLVVVRKRRAYSQPRSVA
jgi:VanZ family protein